MTASQQEGGSSDVTRLGKLSRLCELVALDLLRRDEDSLPAKSALPDRIVRKSQAGLLHDQVTHSVRQPEWLVWSSWSRFGWASIGRGGLAGVGGGRCVRSR